MRGRIEEEDHRKREATGVRRPLAAPLSPRGTGAVSYPSSTDAAAVDYQARNGNHRSFTDGPGRSHYPEFQPPLSPYPPAASGYGQSNTQSSDHRHRKHSPVPPGAPANHGDDDAASRRDSYSIMDALQQLEEQDDEVSRYDDETLTHEPVNSPAHSTHTHSTRRRSSQRSNTLLQYQSFNGDYKPTKKEEARLAEWGMIEDRRTPTTNLGGGAMARSPPRSTREDEDLLLAIALQKEEDEYAAALRADRDRREEERAQLVMQLLEQVPQPPAPSTVNTDQVVVYEAPETIDHDEQSDFTLVNDLNCITAGEENCPICLDALSNGLVVSLRKCGHFFHLDCLDDLLQQSRRCPKCRVDVRSAHIGTAPSGTMKISRPVISRAQSVNSGAITEKRIIQIEYVMPDGEQKEYHDRPGDPYKGTIRVAYLPTNSQGTYLLKRLIFAFRHGMTFRLTRSTDGDKHVVNWASIPHRFSLGEKEFDAIYMANCNDALDQLGVPSSFPDGHI